MIGKNTVTVTYYSVLTVGKRKKKQHHYYYYYFIQA